MAKKNINEAIKKVGEVFNKKTYEKGVVKDTPVTVSVSLKATVNMGNYESMSYGLITSAQANPEYIDTVRQEITEYTEEVLAKKVEEYREMATL